MSTVLSSTVNKSQQHRIYSVNKLWKHQESNQGQLGEKPECYLCAMLPPPSAVAVVRPSLGMKTDFHMVGVPWVSQS